MNVWYLTAIMTGVGGSLHCVGMCGPLAMALPVGRLPPVLRIPALLLYHAGRLSAYALLGLAVGLTGQGLLLAGLQRPVSIGAGLLLLIWTLTRKKYPQTLRSFGLVRWLTAPLSKLLVQPSLPGFGAVGFLNGLLPCGFVYVALTGALAQQTALEGAGYMALFGVGTLPALLGIRFIPTLFSLQLRQRFSRALPIVTVLLALLLIGRGVHSYGWSLTADAHSVPVCHGVSGR